MVYVPHWCIVNGKLHLLRDAVQAIVNTLWFIYHVKRSKKTASVVSNKTQHKDYTRGLDIESFTVLHNTINSFTS